MLNKYLPVLVCGFAASVFATIPGIKNVACCLFLPAATAFSLFLDQKMNHNYERVSMGNALLFGFLTAIVATFFATSFEMLLTYFTRSNDFINTLPQSELMLRELNLGPIADQSLAMMKQVAKDINASGFSLLYLFMILFSNFFSYTIFGILGGIVGMALLNRKRTDSQ